MVLLRQINFKIIKPNPIKTKEEYNQALDENEHFPIDFPDPIEAIKFRMEQLGYTQKDLAEIVGLKSRASEILNKKRKLSLEMIRNLHEKMNIPTEVLIRPY